MNRLLNAAALVIALLTPVLRADEGQVSFNRDVRPILTDNCFFCHGFDPKNRQGGRRLDSFEGATAERDGVRAIVPGEPGKSELWRRINADDEDVKMPPPKSHKTVTLAKKETLRRWIEQGAKYEAHWAFVAPVRAEPPSVKQESWPRNAVDRFILARLEAEKLTPSREAAKETLIRRVSLDLTGLPPTPVEVDAFLADTSPEAYEKVVDRLLHSERYGERMAVDWLDAARYADSNGYQVDRDRELWPWRDWVIRAFNANMPFDQFTIEQLAGDLLPNATIAQKIATGFHRNHMLNEEGGIIPEEFLAEYTADRVETTAAVWLGQTLNCSRCHDHKFDPFTQRDFYGLKAFFHNVTEKGIGNYGAPIRINAPPFLRLPTDEQTTKLASLETDLATTKQQLATATAEAKSGADEWSRRLATTEVKWTAAEFVKVEAGKALLDVRGDVARIEPPNPGAGFTANCNLRLPAGRVTALKIECAHAGMIGAARWLDVRMLAGEQALKLRAVESGDSMSKTELTKTLDGSPQTFTTVTPREDKPIAGVFELAEPIASEAPIELRVIMDAGFGSGPMLWRIFATSSDAELLAPSAIVTLAKKDSTARSAAEQKQLADFYAQQNPAWRAIDDRVVALTQQKDALERDVWTTLVMEEMPEPRPTFVLMRGAYDKPGERVIAATPAVLPPLDEGQPLNRLGLARWLVSSRNPLTARVTVNRLWQQVFGTGLVRTSEDFGSQGEFPSHPELFDWLATEFVRTGWDVKAMMKLLVMSATYRQDSRLTPALRERDPDNRLLARGPRFRLTGEFIRDQTLAASGLLVEKIGGPSVKPYHPAGIYEQLTAGSSTNSYVAGKGDDLHRRSLYTYWKRSVPHPALLMFGTPFRETCTLRRPRTNTPLQALNLMNDPTYVEAARFLAQRMMREGGDTPETRLTHGFRLVLARAPRPAELAVLRASYERSLADFGKDTEAAKSLLSVGDTPADATLNPAQLAAFASVASTLLNLDETVTKE
jgi:hypothetical protein